MVPASGAFDVSGSASVGVSSDVVYALCDDVLGATCSYEACDSVCGSAAGAA